MLCVLDTLRTVFHHDSFRPAQREIVEDVLSGNDVVCIMPTGAGKSLCFQLPAVMQGGLTLIVSPLISLMADQADHLRRLGVPALVLNSSQSSAEQMQVRTELRHGFSGLLYVAPERFNSEQFVRAMQRLKPRLFVIDEAHCISAWGHDFRPEYRRLGEIRRLLGSPRTMALTATATPTVRDDIKRQLGLAAATVHTTGFDRPNLTYGCRIVERQADKDRELLKLVAAEAGTGIVYCSTRRAAEDLCAFLTEKLPGRSVFAYHAGMDQAARTSNQERFMRTAASVMVATNAFGMGINKPDIRFVVHYNVPGSLEAYYQEAGRAGRDGQPSTCFLFFSTKDRRTQEFFIRNIGDNNPALDAAAIDQLQKHGRQKLAEMSAYAYSQTCRRKFILRYFGDRSAPANCTCDICVPLKATRLQVAVQPTATFAGRAAEITSLVLDAIAQCELRGAVGANTLAEVLTGTQSEKLRRLELDCTRHFGALRTQSKESVGLLIQSLIDSGLAVKVPVKGNPYWPVVKLTNRGWLRVKAGVTTPALGAPAASKVIAIPARAVAESRSSESKTKLSSKTRSDSAELTEMTGAAAARFERLRAARLELAKELKWAPFVIFHDSVLREIAYAAPRDMDSLRAVRGVGPQKAQKFGRKILEVLRD